MGGVDYCPNVDGVTVEDGIHYCLLYPDSERYSRSVVERVAVGVQVVVVVVAMFDAAIEAGPAVLVQHFEWQLLHLLD